MRPLLVLLHRWFGLFTALFLAVSGLTGAVISWDHELDEWLNPQLFEAPASSAGRPLLTPLELAARLEAEEPRLRVRFMPLTVEAGRSFQLAVEPRVNPESGELHSLGYNQVALDPASGAVLARREWGRVSLERENLLPFLYKLHYTMHIPDAFGLPLGSLFMGIVAIVWVIDSLVALWIAFPSRVTWRQSFAFRWKAGGYRLVFDLHRSGGVWIYPLLAVLALTSVSMNLNEQVVRPLVALFSPLSPSPFATRAMAPPTRPVEPRVGLAEVLERARAEAARRGWTAPPGGVFLSSAFGVYGVGFYAPGQSHGDGGLGNPWLYFDVLSGEPAGTQEPGSGTAGDVFLQAMFPLHSGRILGLPGRILVSLCGLAVAVLSITGIVIWARKRQARHAQRRRREGVPGLA